jgi:hypothetical protein
MPHKGKGTRKPYGAPSFGRLNTKAAKAALETKAFPGDVGARAMLNSISNSKAASSKTSESNRQP